VQTLSFRYTMAPMLFGAVEEALIGGVASGIGRPGARHVIG
jgi:hypothetical protein